MNRSLLLLVQLLVVASGCVSLDGGAVEARWVLRNARGIAVSCTADEARIDQVVFRLTPQGEGADPCAQSAACRFDCERGVGTTPFVIPEGRYAISLVSTDVDGEQLGEADGVTVPAPIIRDIRFGELTNLNVNLITVDR